MRRPVLDLPIYTPGIYGPWELISTEAIDLEKRRVARESVGDTGYFRGLGTEPHYHVLRERETKKIWMVTSLLEQESHLFHVKHAKGVVVIVGVGMGMVLKAVAAKPDVTKVIAIDISKEVIEFIEHGTDFEQWPGREKIEFVNADALDLGKGWKKPQVDTLYVDIWPTLGDYGTVPQTQAMQQVIKAKRVGWWGQEIDFFDWVKDDPVREAYLRANNFVPRMEDFDAFQLARKLPSYERSIEYMKATKAAIFTFASRADG